jgi:hypothetical protein
VQTVGSNVRVSWPLEYGSYTLESTPSLPGGWSTHPALPSTNATMRFIDLNPSGPARFFRLAQP